MTIERDRPPRLGRDIVTSPIVKYTEVLFAGSDKFSTKKVVLGVQAAAVEGGPTFDMALVETSLDSEGLHRMEHHGHRVIWVPRGADSPKKRLMCVPTWRGPDTAGSMQRWLDLSGTACGSAARLCRISR